MKIEIKVVEDETFQMSKDVETLDKVEETVEIPVEQPPTPPSNATPFENKTRTNSFDIFGGTSWAGTRQRPTDIGR